MNNFRKYTDIIVAGFMVLIFLGGISLGAVPLYRVIVDQQRETQKVQVAQEVQIERSKLRGQATDDIKLIDENQQYINMIPKKEALVRIIEDLENLADQHNIDIEFTAVAENKANELRRKDVPKQSEVSKEVEETTARAQEVKADAVPVAPKPEVTRITRKDEFLNVTAKGTFADVVTYLQAIERYKHFILVDEITMVPDRSKQKPVTRKEVDEEGNEVIITEPAPQGKVTLVTRLQIPLLAK